MSDSKALAEQIAAGTLSHDADCALYDGPGSVRAHRCNCGTANVERGLAAEIQRAIDEAVAAEREACACIADYKGHFCKAEVWGLGADELMEKIADAIRTRGSDAGGGHR